MNIEVEIIWYIIGIWYYFQVGRIYVIIYESVVNCVQCCYLNGGCVNIIVIIVRYCLNDYIVEVRYFRIVNDYVNIFCCYCFVFYVYVQCNIYRLNIIKVDGKVKVIRRVCIILEDVIVLIFKYQLVQCRVIIIWIVVLCECQVR